MTGGACHLVRCEYRAVPHFSKSVFWDFWSAAPDAMFGAILEEQRFSQWIYRCNSGRLDFFHEISYLRPAKVPGNLWGMQTNAIQFREYLVVRLMDQGGSSPLSPAKFSFGILGFSRP